MGWRILYIENANRVRLYLDNIRIERDTGDLTVPLSDIHTLVIDNQMVTITVPLIVKCSEYNINLIFCSLEHMPYACIYPFIGNYQTPQILKKQIAWTEEQKAFIWTKIVKNKIDNQIDLLKYFGKKQDVISKLIQFSNEIEINDITNREGLAAKMYFRELFGADFKRFSEDVVNAGLNYGYSILRSQISKTLIAKGLNPTLGIYHKGYDNPFNLSDDIIEIFRPLIDEYVYVNLLEAIIFKREDRINLINRTTKDVYIQGKRQSLFNAISIFIDKLLYFFETGDIEAYADSVDI